MNKHIGIASLVMLLSACASPPPDTDLFKGENLITPFTEELMTWQMYSQNQGGFRTRMWQKPDRGYADSYAVSVTYRDDSSTLDKRKAVDQPGVDGCASFESKTLVFPAHSGYQVEYWETLCQNGEAFKAKILHLMIRGNDSFYHLQKSWQNDFTAQDVQDWKTRFESVYICDTRLPEAPCPIVEKVTGG